MDTGAKVLLLPLAGLVKLANLHIDLKKNNIGVAGARYLLKPVAHLISLTHLHVDLRNYISS